MRCYGADKNVALQIKICADCRVAGIFFFLPYIIESGIMDVLDTLPLPHSDCIGKKQAFLSLLALKLIGGQRLCHVRQYDHDIGFGLFAGLNVLPKPTYTGTYSCLVSAELCKQLQSKIISCLRLHQPDFFSGSTINLDFHSIPHFGEESEMEKVWCGARHKAMKGANTFFAQDAESNVLLYTNADVLRRDGSDEILRFVDYLKDIKGVVDETDYYKGPRPGGTNLCDNEQSRVNAGKGIDNLCQTMANREQTG